MATTPTYQRCRPERKKVEMLFTHLTRILKLDRLRVRDMSGTTDEFTLAAAVQNLGRQAILYLRGRKLRDSKKPQTNPITEQQSSTVGRITTQCSESARITDTKCHEVTQPLIDHRSATRLTPNNGEAQLCRCGFGKE